MNLNFLGTFVSVVEEGNFSRAAKRLHLSQPAVSMQMQALAQELGVELFRRRGHRVETTEAGSLLYQRARELLQGWQNTIYQLEGLRQRLQGRLELGASTVPGDFLLPPRLCEFYRLHPDLEIRMTVAPSEEIIAALVAGELDLAVVGYKPEVPGLESTVLFQDELIAVFSPGHSLAHRKTIKAEDLSAQPLLQRTQGSATRQVLEKALLQGGKPPRLQVVMELGSSRALLEAAARGLGVAVVSKLAAADFIEQGRLLSLSVSGLELQRNFWLVHQTGRFLSPAVKTFAKYLQRGDYLG